MLKEKIMQLKKEKNALILAHNYQTGDIQDVADFVGDSLALAQKGKASDADLIIVCGVRFMAETAKILSPKKTVLLPAEDAGCPMADMVTAKALKLYREEHPDTTVVAYVNTSADVKALSDICITSSNALRIVGSLESEEILLLPDQNLGQYIKNQFPKKNIDLWRGFCCTHEFLTENEIVQMKKRYKTSPLLMHPECNPKTLKHADFIGSTFQIIQHVKNSDEPSFIIGTEEGILHQLKKDRPDKTFIMASQKLICKNMKKTTLQHLYDALNEERYTIEIDETIRISAAEALNKMLELS